VGQRRRPSASAGLLQGRPFFQCLPSGPEAERFGGWKRILQTPATLAILNDDLTYRVIHMDGRALEANPAPSWMGYSVGRWDGDTLVIDTVGTNGRGRPMNGYVSGAVTSGVDTTPRLPASDQLRVVERLRLVGEGQYLEDEITVNDPKTYRTPWTVKRYWQRRPDIDMQEYACTDNRRRDAEGQEAPGTPAP
jgi:hypothetical protein